MLAYPMLDFLLQEPDADAAIVRQIGVAHTPRAAPVLFPISAMLYFDLNRELT